MKLFLIDGLFYLYLKGNTKISFDLTPHFHLYLIPSCVNKISYNGWPLNRSLEDHMEQLICVGGPKDTRYPLYLCLWERFWPRLHAGETLWRLGVVLLKNIRGYVTNSTNMPTWYWNFLVSWWKIWRPLWKKFNKMGRKPRTAFGRYNLKIFPWLKSMQGQWKMLSLLCMFLSRMHCYRWKFLSSCTYLMRECSSWSRNDGWEADSC